MLTGQHATHAERGSDRGSRLEHEKVLDALEQPDRVECSCLGEEARIMPHAQHGLKARLVRSLRAGGPHSSNCLELQCSICDE